MLKPEGRLTAEDVIIKEYFTLYDIVRDFDQRLLTIKGWGVTLSLASLGLGLQTQHWGFFLVAIASALAFWAIESFTKKHQMQNYLRIRDIEVLLAKLQTGEEVKIFAPLMNWSWNQAGKYFTGDASGAVPEPEFFKKFVRESWWPSFKTNFDLNTWTYPYIYLPHAITIVTGLVFILLRIFGVTMIPM